MLVIIIVIFLQYSVVWWRRKEDLVTGLEKQYWFLSREVSL